MGLLAGGDGASSAARATAAQARSSEVQVLIAAQFEETLRLHQTWRPSLLEMTALFRDLAESSAFPKRETLAGS